MKKVLTSSSLSGMTHKTMTDSQSKTWSARRVPSYSSQKALPPVERRSILDFVGRTPLIAVNKLNRNSKTSIFAKLEGFNPGGSLKDRSALSMVEQAEKEGKLKKNSVLIDSTSGNLGIALALIGAVKRYKVICVVDPKTSTSTLQLLRSLGVQIEKVAEADSSGGYLRARIKLRNQLLEEVPNAWCPDQYGNPANPAAHYCGTGQEILEDTGGKVDYLVCAISTGGTITGCARALKERIPRVKVVGVDAEGSSIFGDTPKKRLQIGIGSSLTAEELPNIDTTLVDQVFLIGDEEAFVTARALASQEGILAGGSSGSVMFGALVISEARKESTRIVTVLPDRYEHNLNECHSDEWMQNNNLPLEATGEAVWRRVDYYLRHEVQWKHESTGIPIIKKGP